MSWIFSYSVVHGKNIKTSETHYFCLNPLCRCELVGSSRCCPSGSGVWDVCDCAQEGQLEVNLDSSFLKMSHPWFLYFLLSTVFFISSPHLCTSFCLFCFSVCLCQYSSVFFIGSAFSHLFGCEENFLQCDTGLWSTERDQSHIIR